MAGFEVTLPGRIWVTPEAIGLLLHDLPPGEARRDGSGCVVPESQRSAIDRAVASANVLKNLDAFALVFQQPLNRFDWAANPSNAAQ